MQEISSINLIKCINLINEFRKIDKTTKNKMFYVGCDVEILDAILEEFLKRFFSPLFIILIGLSSSLVVMSSKNENSYKLRNIFYFCLGIFFIVVSELSLRYSGVEINYLIVHFLIPLLFFILIYLYIYFNNYKLGRN